MEHCRAYPMRLFATWEADRTSTSSVPRLCILGFDRLTILRHVEPDLNSVVLAIKLQGFKRILRSNDINITVQNGIVDVDLDICFTLQYPHYIKRKAMNLFIMLQRRKKYKTRPMPGFKTLAVGILNLSKVLQSSSNVTREFNLYSDKDKLIPVSKLYLSGLSTQPLEQDEAKAKDAIQFDSEEEEDDSTPNEEGGSDSEQMLDDGRSSTVNKGRASGRVQNGPGGRKAPKLGGRNTAARHQKNLKQKFVTLLKKLKVSEDSLPTDDLVESYCNEKPTQREIDALFEELENLSDSAPEFDVDAVSVKSTPKPALPPFFPSSATNNNDAPSQAPAPPENSEESKESGDSQTGADAETTSEPEMSDGFAERSAAPAPSAKTLLSRRKASLGAAARPHSPSDVALAAAATKKTSPPPTSAESSNVVQLGDKKRKNLAPNRQVSADVAVAASPAGGAEKTFLDKLSHHHVFTSASKLRLSSMPTVAVAATTSPAASTTSAAAVLREQPQRQRRPVLVHKSVGEQLAVNFTAEDAAALPDVPVALFGAGDICAPTMVENVRDKLNFKCFVLSTLNDVKSFFSALITRVQRFCNVNASAPQQIKLLLVGGDRFFSHCLRAYVESFSSKPNEWVHFVRFFIVAHPSCAISRHLSIIDHLYNQYFGPGAIGSVCRDWWEKVEPGPAEISEICCRISKLVSGARLGVGLPIAEIMLQLKEKGMSDEPSAQLFVPFLGDVRLATSEYADQLESPVTSGSTTVSPASQFGASPSTFFYSTPGCAAKASQQQPDFSPPGSPHLMEKLDGALVGKAQSPAPVGQNLSEAQDLQLEYWVSGMPAQQAPGLQASPGLVANRAAADVTPLSSGGAVVVGGGARRDTSCGTLPLTSSLTSNVVGGGSASSSLTQTSTASLSALPPLSTSSAYSPAAAAAAASMSKLSLKTSFRSLVVCRKPLNALTLLPPPTSTDVVMASTAPSDLPSAANVSATVGSLALHFVREKKRDKMLAKLGMKTREKENEPKKQLIENISRLICSAKQHTTMTLFIDGVEWDKVKFFQISTQWQTHVKFLPVTLFSVD